MNKIKIYDYVSVTGNLVIYLEIRNSGKAYGVSMDVDLLKMLLDQEEIKSIIEIFKDKTIEMGVPLSDDDIKVISDFLYNLISEAIEEE